MEKSYQEQILEKHHSYEAVLDCFAISRIQTTLGILSGPAEFNEEPRKEMNEQYDELEKILSRYGL